MSQFVKRLETDHGPQSFYFNSLSSAGGPQYHVSVMDPDRKVQFFILEQQNGQWQMTDRSNLPAWIVAMESRIIRTILEEESHY